MYLEEDDLYKPFSPKEIPLVVSVWVLTEVFLVEDEVGNAGEKVSAYDKV